MVFGDRFRKAGFFRDLIYYPLMAGLIAISGCGKDDSSPGGPSNGGGNGGYVEDSGKTDNDGEIKLEVDGEKFDIYVKNENGNALRNIDIRGLNYGRDIYGFLFEDFNGNYFSDVAYVDINDLSSVDGENGETYNLNKELTEARGGEYKKEFLSEDEPYIYNLSDNPNLIFMETVPLDELHDFYVENDAIFRNISLLEFAVKVSNGKRPELDFALKAAKFRQTFIENLNNYSDIVNTVASFFGGSFEKEAYYIDIYENNLHVLTHQTSTRENYATLKGNISDANNNRLQGVRVEVINGPSGGLTFTENNGMYFLKRLFQGNYTFRASSSGFNNNNQDKQMVFYGYTQPRCNTLDFRLTPESRETTIILQPGPEGKDAMLACWMRISSGGDTLFNYINENYKDDSIFKVMYLDYFQRDDHIIDKRNFLIKFDDLPNNSNFYSAKLFIHGFSSNFYEYPVTIEVRRITQSWDENSVNWTNQPLYNSYIYDFGITPMNPNREWASFDLTDLAKGWINGNYSNYGVILNASFDHEGIYNGKTGDYTDSFSERPKLVFIYRN